MPPPPPPQLLNFESSYDPDRVGREKAILLLCSSRYSNNVCTGFEELFCTLGFSCAKNCG